MKSKVSPAVPRRPERHFSIQAVAEQLDVSTRTIRRWINAADLTTHRLGRQIRIAETDLSVFLALRRENSTGGQQCQ